MTTQHELNYQRIEAAIRHLEENFRRQPDLKEIAAAANVSPFHFQRLFTEWAGISAKRFLQCLTVDFLKERLRHSADLFDAAAAAGLSGPARVYDLFTTLEAVTPAEYLRHGQGTAVSYGFGQTPFGLALVAATGRGICWLSFLTNPGDRQAELEKMKKFWGQSLFHENDVVAGALLSQVFGKGAAGQPLRLVAKGTNFQVKVWQALLKLPCGEITTYQQVAQTTGNPRALQAVGSAIGANHIAYLIPCHRVIRKSGQLGEYRWGSARKKCMLGWEMAQPAG